MHERLPSQGNTLHNHALSVIHVSIQEYSDIGHRNNRAIRLQQGPDTLHQADGIRIHTFGFFGDVVDSMGHLEVEPEKVPDFFEQSNNLSVEVDSQL